ncbi:putative ribonuclease H-like domain-containing protein, partial [Tanacetum coccineum]
MIGAFEVPLLKRRAKARSKEKKKKQANIALLKSWENTQAMMEADRLLAERLQSKEREEFTDEEKAKLFMELMEEKKKNILAALKEQEKSKTDPSYQGQQKRTQKVSSFLLRTMLWGSEVHESIEKKKRLKRRQLKEQKEDVGREKSRKEQQKESSKKQKVEEEEESEEVDEAELKKLLVIKKDEYIAIDAIPLAIKLPVIIDYKLLLKREDLEALWRIVKAKYGDTRSDNEFERLVVGRFKNVLSTAKAYGETAKSSMKVLLVQKVYAADYNCLKTYYCQEDKDGIDQGLGSTSGIRAFALRNFDLEVMEFESAHGNTIAKLPILKLGEYAMWVIRIKQYFQIQDYALWEVIENGNSWVSIPQTPQENDTSVTKMLVPVTAEVKTNKKNDVKARSLLLMALPNEHQLTFSQYPDAKTMFAAIETRFGGNEATKKTQKTLLKQQYENFSASSTESLDSIFNSLPPEWNTHVVVWMNKPEIETISIDDLYKNFKIVEQKVKKSVGASSGAQNLAFMTAPSTSSTNDVNIAIPAYEVSTASPNVNAANPQVSTASFSDNVVYAFMVENPNGSNLLQQDLEQIHEDDLEAIDLKWQLSLLSMRAKRYYQRIGKKIFINANDTAGYDKSKVECFNCHKLGHFARECRAPRNKEDQFKNQDNTRKQGNNEDTSSKEMLAIDGIGFDWSDMAEEQVQTNMALMAFSDSKVYTDKTCSKTCLKNYETLKKQCDDLIVKLNQTESMAATYKRGLTTVEEQLITYRKNEVLFSEE